MAEVKTDRELLRDYAEGGSESAFQTLVERHLNLVFATCLRGVNETEAAQEVAQNVFIALARKAPWLQGDISVAGWLHKTALLEVRSWWRGELRRRRREKTAVDLGTTMKDEDSLLKALTGELDEGLLKLRECDRQALLLRYFEGRSHREIGGLLGAREDAVRMRIDKALARLTQFFRRRGYAVPAVATTVVVLDSAAKAAPAAFGKIAANAALSAARAGTVTGLKLLASRLISLTRSQTAGLCMTIVAAPVAWEWNVNRLAGNQAAVAESNLGAAHRQQDQSLADVARLQAEAARLDMTLADAIKMQARYDEGAPKLAAMKGQVAGLLTNANYHWPDDSPYVRVRKTMVKSLDLLNHPPTAFRQTGALTEPALELFGITAQEKAPAEQALASYWSGVEDLMLANAYETNLQATQTGRLTKTVIVPPLGQPLKDLAQNTRAQLTDVLGAEREKLLFDGWDQGAIQIFWPGNLWKISEEPQTFTTWAEPSPDPGGNARYGSSWSSTMGGTSGEGQFALNTLSGPIAERFFKPWLEQFGITNSTPHE